MSTDPPKFNRYRLVEGYREKLVYPSGTVTISFCANREDCWMLYATKDGDPKSFLEIMRRPTMLEWAEARFEGFEVEAGSPADKILAKMAREGNAVKMAPGETHYVGRRNKQPRYH